MARFQKAILSAGIYKPVVPGQFASDGSPMRRIVAIPPQRINQIAAQFSKMKAAGINVPAPFKHDPLALPVTEGGKGTSGTLASSVDNGGFWDKMWAAPNEDGILTLYGELDAPGDANDHNSPAGKVGKTVRETSIYIEPEWTDGLDRKWVDAPMHVALVTHPIEPGQGNFQILDPADSRNSSLKTQGLALAMSHMTHAFVMGDDGSVDVQERQSTPGGGQAQKGQSGIDIKSVLEKLKKVAKIALPDDTTDANLTERLNSALLQMEVGQEDEEDDAGTTRKPPTGGREQTPPTIMAFTEQQIDSIIATNAVNPATGQPFTKAELKSYGTPPTGTQMSQPSPPPAPDPASMTPEQQAETIKQLRGGVAMLMSHMNQQGATQYHRRIEALIQKGVIGKPYADKYLTPHLTNFQMSFASAADGSLQVAPHPLEATLVALEAQQPLHSQGPALNPAMMMGSPNELVNLMQAIAMSAGGVQGSGLANDPRFQTVALPNGLDHGDPAQADEVVETFLINTGNKPRPQQ